MEGMALSGRACAPIGSSTHNSSIQSLIPNRSWAQSAARKQHSRRERTERLSSALRPFAAAAKAGNVEMEAEADISRAVGILKQAAATGAVPAAAVCQALVKLEKRKLADDSYGEIVGGGQGGRRWRLIFNSSSKDIQKAQKGDKGGGFYMPVPAVQQWTKDGSEIQNGIYLGQIAAIVFKGPYEYKKNKLSFDFSELKLRLGPKWFNFNLGSMKKDKAGPFFLLVYVDDEIVAARGRGGGIGLWQRTTPEWEMKTGMSL